MVLSSLFILLFIELCKYANGNPFTIESLEALENHNGTEQRSFRQPSNIWNSISQITEGRVFKLTSPHSEARRNLENAITKKSLGVKIIPYLSDIAPNSVKISWEVEHNNPKLYKKFGFKVSFRSFGSSVEREVIFAIEGDGLDGNMNTYQINGLKASTGYVFCFRVMSHDEVAEAFQSNYALRTEDGPEYSDVKETEDYTENLIESSETTSKSPPTAVFKLTEIINITANVYSSTSQNPNSTSTQPTILIGDMLNNMLNNIKDDMANSTSQEQTTFTTPSSLVTLPNVNLPLVTKPTEQKEESKARGTYAYSSTGERIYMPASSWSPSFKRRKRNLKNYSYTASTDSESARCIEVFTTQSSTLKILNPYILMIVALVIIAIILFLALIYCVKRLLCGGAASKLIKKLCFGKPQMCTTTEVPESSAPGNYNRESSIDEKDRSLECQFQHKEHQQCHCSTSLPSYQEILVRHDLKEKLKGTFRIGKQKSLDSSFHPGYALPPSSTTEVYGYDIPKLSNKGSLVNTPDSMDINDGYGFNENEIYNWNCLTPQKSSSASKYVPKDDKHSAPPIALPKKQNAGVQTINYPERYEVQSVDENDQTYDSLSLRSTTSSRKSSLGDITISGGTLIEVPDGYVVPDRSKGLRLIVTGTPVYL